MIYFFVAAAIWGWILFFVAVANHRSSEQLLDKQAKRLHEALLLAAHWQQRAKDAEYALKYGPFSP